MEDKHRKEKNFINKSYGLADEDHATALDPGNIYDLMHRYRASGFYDVMKKLIGEIEPVADATIDAERLANLISMCELLDKIVEDVVSVAKYQDSKFGSAKNMGRYASAFLAKMIAEIDMNIKADLPIKQMYDTIKDMEFTDNNDDTIIIDRGARDIFVTSDIDGVLSIDGIICTFNSKEIRDDLEKSFEPNTTFELPDKYDVAIIDNNNGKITKIINLKDSVDIRAYMSRGYPSTRKAGLTSESRKIIDGAIKNIEESECIEHYIRWGLPEKIEIPDNIEETNYILLGDYGYRTTTSDLFLYLMFKINDQNVGRYFRKTGELDKEYTNDAISKIQKEILDKR